MEKKPKFKPNPELRLMNQVRQVLRYHSVKKNQIDIMEIKNPASHYETRVFNPKKPR
jgi:hypothetical protein